MALNSRLRIRTVCEDGRTVLRELYNTPPVKAMDISAPGSAGRVVMLMSSAPGLLEGDSSEQSVEVGAGTSLIVLTQSYQRLHPMKEGAAQTLVVRVGAGADLTWLPHPVVPHRGSKARMDTRIDLEGGATLCWAEVLTCGRSGCGERFHFTGFRSSTEIRRHDRLLFREVQWIRPGGDDLSQAGQYGRFTHQALFLFISEGSPGAERLEAVEDLLAGQSEIDAGYTAMTGGGIAVRVLGLSGEKLFSINLALARICGRAIP